MWISNQQHRRGTALLAVLWLSAALATIAIALADTVRGEAERSATAVDGLRSQHLAEGGLRRGILYMLWGRFHAEIPRFKPVGPFYVFDFPEGQAVVEIVPETAKLNINTAPPEDILKVLLNLGLPEGRAAELAGAIVDWRTPVPQVPTAFDDFYQTMRPPYIATHMPFQDIEELLAVKGVTPDVFYGAWDAAPGGAGQHLLPRSGLRDCFSVYGSVAQFDVNTAAPAVLAAAGVPPEGVAALVQQRRAQPFVVQNDLTPFMDIAGQGFGRLRIGGVTMFTLRSTARVRLVNGQLSDLRRTVSALVKMAPPKFPEPYHVLRWYNTTLAEGGL
jgi:general secretion pathway protein K